MTNYFHKQAAVDELRELYETTYPHHNIIVEWNGNNLDVVMVNPERTAILKKHNHGVVRLLEIGASASLALVSVVSDA